MASMERTKPKRPSLRNRVRWRLTARRHRTLTPQNMTELPWARYDMEEQTGEVFDRRTHSRRSALRHFRANLSAPELPITVEKRYARYMTEQEIWEARDRTDEWKAQLEDELDETGRPQSRLAELLRARPVPKTPPADWEPDEYDPGWMFCDAGDPDASPVWFCEVADA